MPAFPNSSGLMLGSANTDALLGGGQITTQAFEQFFGPGKTPIQAMPYTRENHDTVLLPEALKNVNATFIGNTVEMLSANVDNFYVYLLPIERTNSLSISYSATIYGPAIAGQIPQMGTVRNLMSSRRSGGGQLQLHGLGFRVPHGFMLDREGHDHYYNSLTQLTLSVIMTMAMKTMVAILQVGMDNVHAQRERGVITAARMIDARRQQQFFWGIFQQKDRAMDLVKNALVTQLNKTGGKADTWIIAPEVQSYIQLADNSRLEYMRAGERGPQRLEDGVESFTEFQKERVYVTRPFQYDQSFDAVQTLEDRRMIGEIYPMVDTYRGSDRREYSSFHRAIRVHDEERDTMHDITLRRAIVDCNLFGTTDDARGDRVREVPDMDVEQLVASGAADNMMTLFESAPGQKTGYVDYIGEIREKFLPVNDLRDVARSAAAAMDRNGGVGSSHADEMAWQRGLSLFATMDAAVAGTPLSGKQSWIGFRDIGARAMGVAGEQVSDNIITVARDFVEAIERQTNHLRVYFPMSLLWEPTGPVLDTPEAAWFSNVMPVRIPAMIGVVAQTGTVNEVAAGAQIDAAAGITASLSAWAASTGGDAVAKQSVQSIIKNYLPVPNSLRPDALTDTIKEQLLRRALVLRALSYVDGDRDGQMTAAIEALAPVANIFVTGGSDFGMHVGESPFDVADFTATVRQLADLKGGRTTAAKGIATMRADQDAATAKWIDEQHSRVAIGSPAGRFVATDLVMSPADIRALATALQSGEIKSLKQVRYVPASVLNPGQPMTAEEIVATATSNSAPFMAELSALRSGVPAGAMTVNVQSNSESAGGSKRFRQKLGENRSFGDEYGDENLFSTMRAGKMTTTQALRNRVEQVTKNMQNTVERATILTFLYCQFSAATLLAMVDNDIVLPFMVLVARPHATYDVLHTVYMLRGAETGKHYVGPSYTELGDDTQLGITYAAYRFNDLAHIHQPKNVAIAPATLIRRYLGHNGVTSFKHDTYRPTEMDLGSGSLFFMLLPITEYDFHDGHLPKTLSLTGLVTGGTVEQIYSYASSMANQGNHGAKLDYTMAPFYSQFWQFGQAVAPLDLESTRMSLSDSVPAQYLCDQGHYQTYSAHTKNLDIVQTSDGFWGADATYKGCGKVRNGEVIAYEKQNYNQRHYA